VALNQDIETLRKVPLFSVLDREALRLVAFSAESRVCRAGDVVFRRGETSDAGYVVMSGTVALDAADNGAPTPYLAKPGMLIGELALIIDTVRPATAIVREPASLLRIPRATFRRMLEEFPDAAGPIRDLLAARATAMASQLGRIRRDLQALDEANPLSLEK
jgi:CRP-like cAMP-binding protein